MNGGENKKEKHKYWWSSGSLYCASHTVLISKSFSPNSSKRKTKNSSRTQFQARIPLISQVASRQKPLRHHWSLLFLSKAKLTPLSHPPDSVLIVKKFTNSDRVCLHK